MSFFEQLFGADKETTTAAEQSQAVDPKLLPVPAIRIRTDYALHSIENPRVHPSLNRIKIQLTSAASFTNVSSFGEDHYVYGGTTSVTSSYGPPSPEQSTPRARRRAASAVTPQDRRRPLTARGFVESRVAQSRAVLRNLTPRPGQARPPITPRNITPLAITSTPAGTAGAARNSSMSGVSSRGRERLAHQPALHRPLPPSGSRTMSADRSFPPPELRQVYARARPVPTRFLPDRRIGWAPPPDPKLPRGLLFHDITGRNSTQFSLLSGPGPKEEATNEDSPGKTAAAPVEHPGTSTLTKQSAPDLRAAVQDTPPLPTKTPISTSVKNTESSRKGLHPDNDDETDGTKFHPVVVPPPSPTDQDFITELEQGSVATLSPRQYSDFEHQIVVTTGNNTAPAHNIGSNDQAIAPARSPPDLSTREQTKEPAAVEDDEVLTRPERSVEVAVTSSTPKQEGTAAPKTVVTPLFTFAAPRSSAQTTFLDSGELGQVGLLQDEQSGSFTTGRSKRNPAAATSAPSLYSVGSREPTARLVPLLTVMTPRASSRTAAELGARSPATSRKPVRPSIVQQRPPRPRPRPLSPHVFRNFAPAPVRAPPQERRPKSASRGDRGSTPLVIEQRDFDEALRRRGRGFGTADDRVVLVRTKESTTRLDKNDFLTRYKQEEAKFDKTHPLSVPASFLPADLQTHPLFPVYVCCRGLVGPAFFDHTKCDDAMDTISQLQIWQEDADGKSRRVPKPVEVKFLISYYEDADPPSEVDRVENKRVPEKSVCRGFAAETVQRVLQLNQQLVHPVSKKAVPEHVLASMKTLVDALVAEDLLQPSDEKAPWDYTYADIRRDDTGTKIQDLAKDVFRSFFTDATVDLDENVFLRFSVSELKKLYGALRTMWHQNFSPEEQMELRNSEFAFLTGHPPAKSPADTLLGWQFFLLREIGLCLRTNENADVQLKKRCMYLVTAALVQVSPTVRERYSDHVFVEELMPLLISRSDSGESV
ncbi:unnamed protein product [Amoebophrya sp. A120]|nr:unnamed protein product [Amoebophrya sp. A120]|eukprot:GSA120T00018900001.1